MHFHEGLSPTHEMYLKVLYRLQLENHVGRVRDMAKGLGVTPSTVTAVLKKLEHAGLVIHDHYGTVKLTPAGDRVAECVVRRFEIIKALLIEVLGLDTAAAEVDACMMEHAVSPATVNRIESLLHLVRTGETVVQSMHHLRPSVATCSDCEAIGTCQAVAAVEAPASWPERN
ncbi:MAG: metal-dependent transcriptional regulator [Planctomycetota bacterium]